MLTINPKNDFLLFEIVHMVSVLQFLISNLLGRLATAIIWCGVLQLEVLVGAVARFSSSP